MNKTDYQRKCYQAYKRRTKNPPKLWQYEEKTGLYFCGISSSGKEIWRPKKFMLCKKERLRISKLQYQLKIKQLPNLGLKLGDPCPHDPNLVVVHKAYNKVYFGTLDKLIAKRKRWMDLHKMRNK